MTVRWTTALAGADHAGPVVHLLGRPQVTDGATTYAVAAGGARLGRQPHAEIAFLDGPQGGDELLRVDGEGGGFGAGHRDSWWIG